MQFSIARTELVRLLTAVERVVEARSTIPILGNVLLTAGPSSQLTVRGTNLDIEASADGVADVQTPGAVTVDASRFLDIAKKVTGETVNLKLDGSGAGVNLIVNSGRSRFVLPTIPADDFPSLAAVSFTHEFTVDLAALFAPVQFAVSNEETRYYLNGVFLHRSEASLRAVCTDGHRLARYDMPAPEGSEGMPGIIVPKRAVAVFASFKGDAMVSVSDKRIRGTVDGVTVTSKLIDGTFPDYQRIIPKDNNRSLIVTRDEFAKAIDRVSTISSERGRAVKVSAAADSARLDVGAGANGNASEDVMAEYKAEPVEVGFNSKYLAEALRIMTSDKAELLMGEHGGPVIIQAPGKPEWMSLIMPMRV